MEGIFVPLGFFAMVVLIVYLSIRKKERLALIEKGADAKIFMSNGKSNTTLKWGLFLIGLGVGLIIANILVKYYVMEEEAAYFSMIFLFGGIALVMSHFLGKKRQ